MTVVGKTLVVMKGDGVTEGDGDVERTTLRGVTAVAEGDS